MKIPIYQVDAFTEKLFGGNPAAVCPLKDWLPEDILQKIAMENNLAETAFYVIKHDRIEIRWFTPIIEVDLCGHATLAAAHVLFNYENYPGEIINFYSHRSGLLSVKKEKKLILNFPSDELKTIDPTAINSCFNLASQEVYEGRTDYMLVFSSEEDVKNLIPDFTKIERLPARGVIVTAPGNEVDFVSRFFAPQSGISEDPVTGSAHTSLTPYWAEKLGKNKLTATQISQRKGSLVCQYLGDRVEISGEAVLYMKGEIYLNE